MMNPKKLAITTAVVLGVMFARQVSVSAQEPAKHHHYKLVVVGTLGGPNSFLSGPEQQTLNNQGTFVAFANTATPNPNPGCFVPFNSPDCFVERPVVLHNGKLTEMAVLPGGVNGQTDLITGTGLVAGWSENGLIDPLTGLPESRAVLWTLGGKAIDLGTVAGGTESLAVAANDLGQVVGFSNNDVPDPFSIVGSPTQTRAFLWQNGAMKDLGTLGGTDAIAGYVNEAGQIAGAAYTNSDFSTNCSFPLTTHAFFWENGKMVDLGTFGGSCSNIGWMNNSGQIVGYANTPDENNHAFVWNKKGGLKNLGELPEGSYSMAEWINEAGEIVGGSDGGTFFHAVLWKSGAVIDLGTVYGETCSEAYSINSGGQIVGYASADCSNEDHAFLAENGAIVDVNTLIIGDASVTVVNAFDINDQGEIAGWGPVPSGDLRAVLLIPCDENHPGIEGCDYNLVDSATTAEVHREEITKAPEVTSQPRLSPAELMARFRSLQAGRNHRFGAPQTSPQ